MRKRVVPVSISMPPDLALQLRVLAAQKNRSRSQLVCEMLRKVMLSVSNHRRSDVQTRDDGGGEVAAHG